MEIVNDKIPPLLICLRQDLVVISHHVHKYCARYNCMCSTKYFDMTWGKIIVEMSNDLGGLTQQ